jgi:hypothetical protein
MTAIPTQTKLIEIVCSRPLKTVSVEIDPHDTASDVLEKAGLNAEDHMLMKPGDQADYGPTEVPFHDVADGGKLHVVPHSTVGA